MTEYHLSLWHLADLPGTLSPPEHLRETSADFAIGSALTLLPGARGIAVRVIHDNAERAGERAIPARGPTAQAIPFAPGSWLRPQFRVGVEGRAAVPTVWRIGHSARDGGGATGSSASRAAWCRNGPAG